MDKVKASRPKRVKRTPIKKEVQPPLSAEDKELFEEDTDKMKYAPRMKVGSPKISAPGKKVTTVGLGNLKVITVNGDTNV